MTDALSARTRVTAVSDQVSTNLSGEEIILHLETGIYYGLDPVGARIWALLRETTTVGDICTSICAEYDIDPEQCQQDVQQFLLALAAARLIEVCHDATVEATPTAERWLLLQALGAVGLIRLALWVLPFPLLRKLLAKLAHIRRSVASRAVPGRLGWAVTVTSRCVPGATCLTQALAAELLLRWTGYRGRLHIGVSKLANGRLLAHAWLMHEDNIIIGGGEHGNFSPLPPVELLNGRGHPSAEGGIKAEGGRRKAE